MSAAAEAVAEEAPVAEEVVAEEAAKEVEKPAKTVSNTPDPTVSAPQHSLLALLALPPVIISLPVCPYRALQDTTCYSSLPTPKAVVKSQPAPARSGSGPGYVDGVEVEVRRLGESVV